MPARPTRWLTTQETAAIPDTTSAEVCRMLSLGRLSGTKEKDPLRGGTAQWLVNRRSIPKEKKRRISYRALIAKRPKRPAKLT